MHQWGRNACEDGLYNAKYGERQRQNVKGGRKVNKDDSNSSGKCTDENGADNVNSDGDADSDGDKIIQPKDPTKSLVKKLKRKVEE